ncbi:metalloendopeptidase [Elysia marginata]|uniref:Metalloendopeptidase n=1 Tax=Elysia marginata TaxID=1093978 RepID=A0AAV4JVW9_9GAST|nr:metalloendopeptidase [Elysia marginata]
MQSPDHTMSFYFKALAKKLISNKKKTVGNGDTMNWLLVKSLQYRRDDPHALFYRYDYEDHLKRVSLRGRGKPVSFEDIPKQAYKKMLPISKSKKADLLKLCKPLVIPKEVHAWYESLSTSDTAKHLTPEPAEGDSEYDMPAV